MRCMEVQNPDITPGRISQWIREFTSERTTNSARASQETELHDLPLPTVPEFSFEEVEVALRRAQSKTYVRTIKMLRRCLRNQGAVNDSLIAAVCELITVNRQMSDELRVLHGWLANAQREMKQLRLDTRILKNRLEQICADFLSFEMTTIPNNANQRDLLD